MTSVSSVLRLDAITAWWTRIEAMLAESDGEVTPEIQAELEAFTLTEADKVDAYVAVVKDLEARAEATKAYREAVAKKEASLRRQAEWLLGRVEAHMQATGVRELRGRIWRFAFRKNGGQTPVEVLVDPQDLPPEFRRVTYEPLKSALREMLEKGYQVSFARLGERGESLRVY